jgi:hypothetical protein
MVETVKHISNAQRKVLKVLKAGGVIYVMPRTGYKYRLLDNLRNPLRYVHGRTFKALHNKQLITKNSDGSKTAIASDKPKKNRLMVYNKQTVSFDQWKEKLNDQWIAQGNDKNQDWNDHLLESFYHQGMDIDEAIMEYPNE